MAALSADKQADAECSQYRMVMLVRANVLSMLTLARIAIPVGSVPRAVLLVHFRNFLAAPSAGKQAESGDTDQLVGVPTRDLAPDGRRAAVATGTNRRTGTSCNRVMCISAEIAKGATRVRIALRTT